MVALVDVEGLKDDVKTWDFFLYPIIRIHGTGIFTYIWLFLMVIYGKCR